MVELLVAIVRVLGSSPTNKLVHAKWIAFAICLFLNDLVINYDGFPKSSITLLNFLRDTTS